MQFASNFGTHYSSLFLLPQDLIKDLFGKCFEMKMRLGEQHVEVHEDMRSLVRSTRQDAMTSLEKLRDQQPTSTAEERLKTIKDKVGA